MKPDAKLLKDVGFPEAGIVMHNGTWYEPDDTTMVTNGDVFWHPILKLVSVATSNLGLAVILRAANVPPRPTPEMLGEGWEFIGDAPVDASKIGPTFESRGVINLTSITSGDGHAVWRWLVRRKKQEPVVEYWKRSIHRHNWTCKTVDKFITEHSTGITGEYIEESGWLKITAAEYEAAKKKAQEQKPLQPMTVADCPVGSVMQYPYGVSCFKLTDDVSDINAYEVLGWAWPQEVWASKQAGRGVEWRKS